MCLQMCTVNDFYRASACNACRARYYILSVRPSVQYRIVYTVSTRMDIVALFWHSGRGIILVFSNPHHRYKIPKGILSAGALDTMRVGKFCKCCHLSRKRYEIWLQLLWNARKSLVADRFVSVPGRWNPFSMNVVSARTWSQVEHSDSGKIIRLDSIHADESIFRFDSIRQFDKTDACTLIISHT